MSDRSSEPEDQVVLRILAWGTFFFFAVGSWFAQPQTTHYIYHVAGQDGTSRIREVDLISLREGSSEPVKKRGRGILIFGLFSISLWLTSVCVLNYRLTKTKAIRRVPDWAVYTYALVLAVFFVGYVLRLVDVVIESG